MEKQLERKRKSKGSLSVMDEFTGEAGVIHFQPTISAEEQTRIDHKTRFADVPTSAQVQTYPISDLSVSYTHLTLPTSDLV